MRWRLSAKAGNIVQIVRAYDRTDGNLKKTCKLTKNSPITILKYAGMPFEELSRQADFSENQLEALEQAVKSIEALKRPSGKKLILPPKPTEKPVTHNIMANRNIIYTPEILNLLNSYMDLPKRYRLDKENLPLLMDTVPVLTTIIQHKDIGGEYSADCRELESKLTHMGRAIKKTFIRNVLNKRFIDDEIEADDSKPYHETKWYKATKEKLNQGWSSAKNIENLFKQGKLKEAKQLFLEERIRWDKIFERWEVLGLGTDLENGFNLVQIKYERLGQRLAEKPKEEKLKDGKPKDYSNQRV